MPLSLSLSLTDASGADRRRISLPGLAAGLAWPDRREMRIGFVYRRRRATCVDCVLIEGLGVRAVSGPDRHVR